MGLFPLVLLSLLLFEPVQHRDSFVRVRSVSQRGALWPVHWLFHIGLGTPWVRRQVVIAGGSSVLAVISVEEPVDVCIVLLRIAAVVHCLQVSNNIKHGENQKEQERLAFLWANQRAG